MTNAAEEVKAAEGGNGGEEVPVEVSKDKELPEVLVYREHHYIRKDVALGIARRVAEKRREELKAERQA